MFRNRILHKGIILVFWLIVWQLLALVVDNQILLVTPYAVLKRLLELLVQSSFWIAVGNSLLRIGVGFLCGFFVAIVLAGLSFRYFVVEELLQPLMSLVKTVPVASFVVLLLIWWGSDLLAVAICFLVVLPNIYINTLEGLKATDKRLLEMASVFHMPAKNRFFYIYRPALRPFLESGMKLALGMCWKSGVAAEVIGTPEHSIGGQLYLSKIHLDTAGVLAWTAVVILLSLCFEKLILWLADRFFAWNPSTEIVRNRIMRKYIAGKRIVRCHGNSGVCESNCVGEGENDVFGKMWEVPRIVLDKVSKSYGEKEVLAEVSAVYEAGGSYYLTSPSGSGKTTLLRLLCGLEKPDSGRIEGADRYSMVFQEDRLCEDYTAVQNVAMVIGDEGRAKVALRTLLDEDALSKPCRQLSGGMKRRVVLVRAMEAASHVVLLDEPFTGMDAATKQMAEAYIREKQNGRILIIATHI